MRGMRRPPVGLVTLVGGLVVGYGVGQWRCPTVARRRDVPVVSTGIQTSDTGGHNDNGARVSSGVAANVAHGTQPDTTGSDNKDQLTAFTHAALKWGIPSPCPDTIVREGVVMGYDRKFREERGVHPKFRAKLTDYRGSGFDRGHLAPAADHRSTRDAMKATFSLANVSPQVGRGFNRDYWARLERWTRGLTSVADAVFVVTGPLYLPEQTDKGLSVTFRRVGEWPGVAVPTHFFKAVLLEMPDGTVAAGVFVLPNRPIPESAPLKQFLSTLDFVDRAAGVLLFDRLQAWAQGSVEEADDSQEVETSTEGGVTTAIASRHAKPIHETVPCELPRPDWWKHAKPRSKL